MSLFFMDGLMSIIFTGGNNGMDIWDIEVLQKMNYIQQ